MDVKQKSILYLWERQKVCKNAKVIPFELHHKLVVVNMHKKIVGKIVKKKRIKRKNI